MFNEGDCGCGSINCNAETGYYCLALLNKCAKMKIAPICVNTDGSAANSETCTCGSSECEAEADPRNLVLIPRRCIWRDEAGMFNGLLDVLDNQRREDSRQGDATGKVIQATTSEQM